MRDFISRHDVVKRDFGFPSPLTIGNGRFAFTCDITGLQTLYDEQQEAGMPLCTMAEWGWNSIGNPEGPVEKTGYEFNGRHVYYASESHRGNEQSYNWFRTNPHKFDLVRLSFWDDGFITKNEINSVFQRLNLYDGILESMFGYGFGKVEVKSVCHPQKDILGFQIKQQGDVCLNLFIAFPGSSPDISGADWEHCGKVMVEDMGNYIIFTHSLEKITYKVILMSSAPITISDFHDDGYILDIPLDFTMTVGFYRENCVCPLDMEYSSLLAHAKCHWNGFWSQTVFPEIMFSNDKLTHRAILSLYLTAIQCSGTIPPAETGLTCNSWYGKFHLEMHPWHIAYAPFWNHKELLVDSLEWYRKIKLKARENAACNGYKGLRWPKMVDHEGNDSPSRIAVFLIWQQPHLIYLLDCLNDAELYEKYWDLIEGTADFMADYPVYNSRLDIYEMLPPLIPAQEVFEASTCFNPSFELEYWRWALKKASYIGSLLGKKTNALWLRVANKLSRASIHDGVYVSAESAPDTFEKNNSDHPIMLACLGFLPGTEIDKTVMLNTIKKVDCIWQKKTLWGWDYALMSMTYARLGLIKNALSILLTEAPHNIYLLNGNCPCGDDLPSYLPANGSLLLALSIIQEEINKMKD